MLYLSIVSCFLSNFVFFACVSFPDSEVNQILHRKQLHGEGLQADFLGNFVSWSDHHGLKEGRMKRLVPVVVLKAHNRLSMQWLYCRGLINRQIQNTRNCHCIPWSWNIFIVRPCQLIILKLEFKRHSFNLLYSR